MRCRTCASAGLYEQLGKGPEALARTGRSSLTRAERIRSASTPMQRIAEIKEIAGPSAAAAKP